MNELASLGKVFYQYPLKKHTSWWAGGYAECCFFPNDKASLLEAMQKDLLPKPLTWLGLGSNVLIRDGGLSGTVCMTMSCLNDLYLLPDDKIYVGAGVTCAKFARFCAKHGFSEAAFFSGVPGTMGGALAMNAGAFGGETWAYVDCCEVVDPSGNTSLLKNDRFCVGYRQVTLPFPLWFLGGAFALPRGDGAAESVAIKGLLKKRAHAQPIGEKSCGSVFRNPKGDFAARLIEAAGCKGMALEGAEVSNKHANFIINRSNASAEAIEKLAEVVQAKVKECSGIHLEPEFHVLGGEV